MIISKNTKENFIFKTRIEFDYEGQGEFLEIRELAMSEQNKLLSAGKLNAEGEPTEFAAMIAQADKLLPGCIIDHSGVDEEGNKVTPETFCNYLRNSASIYQEILTTWVKSKRPNLSVKKTEGENPLV